MSKEMREQINKVKNFGQFVNENINRSMDKWYLVKNGDEFFAEKITKLPHHDKPTKLLFRDFNNHVMSLGKDEQWAKEWIQTKNEIDGGY
jgi:hypothetical protein